MEVSQEDDNFVYYGETSNHNTFLQSEVNYVTIDLNLYRAFGPW